MRRTHMRVLPAAAVAGALACANASAQDIPSTCQYGDLTRSIEVVYADPGQPLPCEVIYDKPDEGGLESLYQAQNEAGYCEARAKELVSRLEGFGWQCEGSGTGDAAEATADAPVDAEQANDAAEAPAEAD